MWATFNQGLSAGWSKVTRWWSGTAVPWFASLPGKVGGYFARMWGQFSNGISQGWSQVTGWWSSVAQPWFASIPSKIRSAVGSMGNILWDAGVGIMNGFLGGLRSKWDDVTSFVGGIGDWIAAHKGPLSYDRQLLVPAGQAIMQGLRDGLHSQMGGLRRDVGGVTSLLAGVGGSRAGGASIGTNVNPGALGQGRSLVLQQGAIQVITPTHDPVQVAQMTVDRLVRSAR
jgi:phage-related protein